MTSRSVCFFDIQVGENNVGRIMFELFNDICPRTCENFRCLCTGEKGRIQHTKLYYKKCHFHRIVKGVVIESGDLSKGSGAGNKSIYGGLFDDETFQIKHDRAYLLSMVNQGPNTNGSQFFITTSVASHLDGKHVVFGHVISGQSVVDEIQNIPADSNNRPLQDVVISRCGELIYVSKNDKKKIKKKKKKHRRHKKVKQERIDELTNTTDEKSNEIFDRNIIIPKTTIDFEVIPEKPADEFFMEENLNDEDDINIADETSNTNITDYHSSKRIDSCGRSVKGRGLMKYTARSRSRSRTPSHWRSALEDREREHIHKKKDRGNREDLCSSRHNRRGNDRHHHHRRSSKYSSSSTTNTSRSHHHRPSKYSSSSSTTNTSRSHHRCPSKYLSSSSTTNTSQSYHRCPSKPLPSLFSRSSSHSSLSSINKSSDHSCSKSLPVVGNIYCLRASLHDVFGLKLDASGTGSSSTRRNRNRANPRPCLVRAIIGKDIELLIITTFNETDPSDPNVLKSLKRDYDYLRNRIIPISSENDFEEKQIFVKSTGNDGIRKSYLVLVPTRKPIPERLPKSVGYIEANDLSYIDTRLKEVDKYSANDDVSDNDTQTESSLIDIFRICASPKINSIEKVQVWMRKHLMNQSFDNDDDEQISMKHVVNQSEDYLSSPERLIMQRSTSIKSAEVLFAVGGLYSGDAIASVEMFDPSSNQWSVIAPMSKRRCGVGVGVLNNLLYAIGGHDDANYLNSVERYNPQINQWDNGIPTNSCRASVGVAVLDGCLFVVGGQDEISCLNLVEKYDPFVQQWNCVASMGTKRSGIGVAVVDGYLYAIGGSDGQCSLSTVERYDLKTNKWSSASSMNARRKHFGCTVYNGYIYVVGGRDDVTELSTVERFYPETNQWSPVPAMNSKRSQVGLAVVHNHLMAIGGFDGTACLKSVELYDCESNNWRLHSEMNYSRLGTGVGVIKIQQNYSTLYESNLTSIDILSTSSDQPEK